MKIKPDYSLYLVTDRSFLHGRSLEEVTAQAVAGGCTLVQLREKSLSSGDFFQLARALKEQLQPFRVPLIIDDRADIMLAAGADGVHVGQSDIPAAAVRALIGPEHILGVSAHTLEEALQAERDGADYLGVGAMFPTATKPDASVISMEELRKITARIHSPAVVIGGINRKTLPLFAGTGIQGAAVVSDIMGDHDPRRASEILKKEMEKIL